MKTWAWNKKYVLCQDLDGKFGLVRTKKWVRAIQRYEDVDIR